MVDARGSKPTDNVVSSEKLNQNPPKASGNDIFKAMMSGTAMKRPASSRQASDAKKRKPEPLPATYAPPSTYAHLPLLPDAISDGLLVLFVGLNPGVETARSGHAYAHPTNHFWRLLFSSGITPRACRPEEDGKMPELYSLGLTNIVSRPSRNGAELSKQEMDDGVALLHEKARKWRPESMCIVGKSIWESIWRVRHGKPPGKNFKYGWQDTSENMGVIRGEWKGARVFVATTTSALAKNMSMEDKQEIWYKLGSWVMARRVAREKDKVEAETNADAEAQAVVGKDLRTHLSGANRDDTTT